MFNARIKSEVWNLEIAIRISSPRLLLSLINLFELLESLVLRRLAAWTKLQFMKALFLISWSFMFNIPTGSNSKVAFNPFQVHQKGVPDCRNGYKAGCWQHNRLPNMGIMRHEHIFNLFFVLKFLLFLNFKKKYKKPMCHFWIKKMLVYTCLPIYLSIYSFFFLGNSHYFVVLTFDSRDIILPASKIIIKHLCPPCPFKVLLSSI